VFFEEGLIKAKTKLGQLYIHNAKFMVLSFWALHLNFKGFFGDHSTSKFFSHFDKDEEGQYLHHIIKEEMYRIINANHFMKTYHNVEEPTVFKSNLETQKGQTEKSIYLIKANGHNNNIQQDSNRVMEENNNTNSVKNVQNEEKKSLDPQPKPT
jgi:hypothetical protein